MTVEDKDYNYRIVIDSKDKDSWTNSNFTLPHNPEVWAKRRFRSLPTVKGLITRLANYGVTAHIEKGETVWTRI